MLDGDDVTLVAFSGGGGGVIGFILLIAVLIVMCVIVSQNEDECAQMKCADGTAAVLMDHECRCVSRPLGE